MNALYNFAVGPLAWIAFTVCIGGMIWRLWSLGRLARQRDASALAYMNWKDSLTSIIRWTLPFSTCGWRENPLLTVANFVPPRMGSEAKASWLCSTCCSARRSSSACPSRA